MDRLVDGFMTCGEHGEKILAGGLGGALAVCASVASASRWPIREAYAVRNDCRKDRVLKRP